MGILSNAKQFLAEKMVSAAIKTADEISTLAVLSPKQAQEVEDKRIAYLSNKPDMGAENVQHTIEKNMGAIGIEVYQAYLEHLSNIYSPVTVSLENFDEDNRIRFFEITKWVTDTEEQSLDKLANVYHVLNQEDCNIALIYHRTLEKCQVTLAMVNTNERNSDPAVVDEFYERVIGAMKGNFPGADIQGVNSKCNDFGVGIPECLINLDDKDSEKTKSIAIVSNVASEKSEYFVSQSMEKLLDGIVPTGESEEYTIVLLAKPIRDQLESKNRLFDLSSKLAPYASWQTGYTYTESDGFSSMANAGVNLGVSAGNNCSVSTSAGMDGVSAGISHGFNMQGNFGVSFARASTVTAQIGKNESITQTYVNYGVKHTLEILESQMKRIEESSALGMWDFAAYIVSESPVVANNVAHMYLALTQGNESFLTKGAISFWDGDISYVAAKTILSSVQKLQHPVFGLKTSLEDEWLMYPNLVTPTTSLSGKELAKALNFPRKSVSGLPVLEVVAFGREPHSLLDEKLELDIGCGYHMRKKIPEQRIALAMNELTKHTFITGSTGSGKSNTVYKLLDSLNREQVGFLVIEPAKGEYKDILGQKEGVITYGTNPNMRDIQMLRINPFRFPQNTHILEHLDRLVEIFNVCWPMYAAMPAILKDSVERAYKAVGWDLEKSTNRYDENLFPSFLDVVTQVKKVLDESDYSDDNKGDYTGSLVTRLRSLTNGINGLIFTTDDILDENLFNGNVIVDLSRIGSSETKSLIMGILVLKLQEYRMEQRALGSNTNSSLRHVTVLEEAHNLLKRTSTEQTSEGSNLLGKSVEMLANSIAEMRTYGEGFIIADQSPGLLDMSVIRNTNTKIILRLPDYTDRELVGRSAGLSENQIIEIAKLEKGVAAILQSDWLEPVLCKIDKYENQENDSNKKTFVIDNKTVDSDEVTQSLLESIMNSEIYRDGDRVDILRLKGEILKSKLDSAVKCSFLEYISADDKNAIKALRQLIYSFFEADKAIDGARDCRDIYKWVHAVVNKLNPSIVEYSKQQIDLVMALIIYEQSLRDSRYDEVLCCYTEIFRKEGGVY